MSVRRNVSRHSRYKFDAPCASNEEHRESSDGRLVYILKSCCSVCSAHLDISARLSWALRNWETTGHILIFASHRRPPPTSHRYTPAAQPTANPAIGFAQSQFCSLDVVPSLVVSRLASSGLPLHLGTPELHQNRRPHRSLPFGARRKQHRDSRTIGAVLHSMVLH
jgi:hypothetical protein